MRTLRLLLVFLSSILLFFSFLYLTLASDSRSYSDLSDSSESKSSLRAFFSFRSPGSFFTPSATISLTDDNSTFFAARPAAFGPLVPSHGLSGEIWIGSGFGDDNLRRRGLAATVEGELGCDDIPGWADRDWHSRGRERVSGPREVQSVKANDGSKTFNSKLTKGDSEDGSLPSARKPETPSAPAGSDGTDDSFHFPLPSTSVRKTAISRKAKSKASGPGHADIQSMQESAEIQGKVVLLSRGGCGFSEKVKWAQRRGATAVIVGDSVRGGPLIRMYAHGDTSNITIPSLFTSHTTAHLLSSLVPPGLDLESSQFTADTLSANPNAEALRKTSTKDGSLGSQEQGLRFGYSSDPTTLDSSESSLSDGWLRSVFRAFSTSADSGSTGTNDKTRKPPRSGRVKWLKMEDYDEEQAWEASGKSSGTASRKSSDAFVIGVHDWRDPDIVHHATPIANTDVASAPTSHSQTGQSSSSRSSNAKGRVITPGSGEYNSRQPVKAPAEISEKHSKIHDTRPAGYSVNDASNPPSEEQPSGRLAFSSKDSLYGASGAGGQQNGEGLESTEHRANDPPHEGLWVTLTLTSMNTNPFFHTLFVLVVSPLITLAVVYTMLLIRSRIRQRRWRAPKSVVEQLPVRVYQALSNRSSANNSSEGSPTQNACSSTTPLLVPPRPSDLNTRPRSRTVCGTSGSVPSGSSANYGSLESHLTDQEKPSGPSSWRKRYGGKQVECCVCLEEYVDGVSKVMSLPCGHDFHVECITPWLTTRRRTCPICKWDVVRSMSNKSTLEESTSPEDGEDVQTRAAETVNRSPSATRPLPSPSSSFTIDVERGGTASPPPEDEQGSSSWISRNVQRGIDSISSLGHTGAPEREDRDLSRRTPSPDRNR